MSVGDFGSQFALDMQGLQRLKHSARQDAASGVKGAAQQFEALFIQMMMKSMRDAVPTSGLVDSQQTQFYQSLLDQQWSQTLASRGMGLADTLVNQLEGSGMVPAEKASTESLEALVAGIPRGTPRVLQDALRPAPPGEHDTKAAPTSFLDAVDTGSRDFLQRVAAEPVAAGTSAARAEPAAEPGATRPEHVTAFAERLAGPARAASRATGVPAELILAQAALETGWGRHEIATADGGNSHNLFGIKAGGNWQGATTEVTTHEYRDGQRTRATERFRVYDSFEAAFTDYARLIGDNPRYGGVARATSAAGAARALQAGGYATDPAYADKLIAVMESLGPLDGAGEPRLARRD